MEPPLEGFNEDSSSGNREACHKLRGRDACAQSTNEFCSGGEVPSKLSSFAGCSGPEPSRLCLADGYCGRKIGGGLAGTMYAFAFTASAYRSVSFSGFQGGFLYQLGLKAPPKGPVAGVNRLTTAEPASPSNPCPCQTPSKA
jgi:hypothetical protein